VTGSAFADCKPRAIENIVAITIPNSDLFILDIVKIYCSNYK
jgi:hypothetical protein